MEIQIHCAHKDVLPIAELKKKFHPENPNVHPEDQIERIAKIIKAQGIRKPATISNQSGRITAGHGRILGAERAGLTHYPVDYQDYDSKELEYADLTADNAVAAWADLDLSSINTNVLELGPDFDIDLLGIEDFVLDLGETLEPGCDEDEVPEVVEPKAKLGDIYQLGNHRLMCGDSTSIDAVEKLMNGEEIQLLYTDPPYGIEIVRNGTVGGVNIAKPGQYKKIHGDNSTEIARDVFHLVSSLNVPLMCIWGGNYFTDFLPPKMGWIIWDKRGEMASNNFSDCELAWTNLNKAARIHKQTWCGMIREGERDKRVHPTQKPIKLAEFCFDLLKASNVLDLFGGSGSTLIACEKTNRKCFMMELDPHYCDVIVSRWEKYTGRKAELLNQSTY